MVNKTPRFYVDWWNVRRSTVYGAAAAFALLALIAGGWFWLRDSSFKTDTAEANIPKDAARIIAFEGDVRVIRASSRETVLVNQETYVEAGDTIQTQADGRAQVRMIDGSTLSVKPNSTVVIRDSASIFGGTNVRVTLDDGQINVKTREKGDASENVVEMLESENRLGAETDASFNLDDAAAGGEIRISRGGVESNTGGERVSITEGEFAAVAGGKISARERLLDAPKLVAPSAAEQVAPSVAVSFRWQRSEANSPVSYDLQIAKSPFFAADLMITERERLTNQIFSVPGFDAGVYYWRVRASTQTGQRSDWSEPRKITVVKPSGAGIAAGEWQVETVGGGVYRISGRTAPGTIVRVGDRETFAAADGAFTVQTSTAGRSVTIDFSDEQGSRSRYNLSLTTGNAVRQN